MKFNKTDWGILWRVTLLLTTLLTFSFTILKGQYIFDFVILPVVIFQVVDFYRLHKKAQDEVEQFVESIHYRDFSRHFNVKQAPVDLQPLRQGFNEINSTFKVISKEKETQYQYLQKVLELVDTGILSYETTSGDIIWMNESLKRILQVPYLKTIHSLDKRDHTLYTQISSLTPGERSISTIHREKSNLKVVLSATAFQTENIQYKLIAFQNVNEALEETESKAWQKLLSVMTHEIMNSVAPISSLANTLQSRLKQFAQETPDPSGIAEDLELGIDTIRKRSEGLLKFTETYRNLNKITKANLAKVFISELFENLHRLMQPTLAQKNIEAAIILKEPLLSVEIDAGLIEQVLINLILNAIDAVKSKPDPKIVLSAYTDNDSKIIIKLADNGSGMPDDVLDKIFVPFFSTKKNGNGIGLSLCKQIMMVHKGSITVQSKENEGTAFYLRF
ncbi:MAG: HAMP domain-containing histidine kinase [Bacteroidetes bacterium]|nr:HAMP domain-containing histidine kinase [Bacteroidota bacterium]